MARGARPSPPRPGRPPAQLSARIAEHLSRAAFEAIPPDAIEITKRSLLDAMGVSLAASRLGEGCEAFVKLARSAGQGAPESTLLGHGDKVAAPLAALANGAMAHALDYEDAFDGAPLHPNAAMVAAALAEAEAIGGVSGRNAVTWRSGHDSIVLKTNSCA